MSNFIACTFHSGSPSLTLLITTAVKQVLPWPSFILPVPYIMWLRYQLLTVEAWVPSWENPNGICDRQWLWGMFYDKYAHHNTKQNLNKLKTSMLYLLTAWSRNKI